MYFSGACATPRLLNRVAVGQIESTAGTGLTECPPALPLSLGDALIQHRPWCIVVPDLQRSLLECVALFLAVSFSALLDSDSCLKVQFYSRDPSPLSLITASRGRPGSRVFF